MGDIALNKNEVRESDFVWLPDAGSIERSRLQAFITSRGLAGVEDLQSWAAEDVGRYWDAAVQDLGLPFHRPYSSPLDLSLGVQWPEWFVGGGFNYVQAALGRWIDEGQGDRIALVWEGDDGEHQSLTFSELYEWTMRFAGVLLAAGVEPGDRVGIFLPMVPETAVAVLAAGAIGAIYVPMFSGYGPEAVSSRLNDAGVRVLVTADGFYRRGVEVSMKQIADEAMAASPSVTACIVLRRTGSDVPWNPARDSWWHDLEESAEPILEISATAANDPFMIIYTSGTTGKPKGALHVHAGFPIKAAHDMAYCFDVRESDTVFWMTDLGWMMGPWLIAGGLMLGAAIVLYEGTPDYPHPDRLWRVAERSKATVLGVAPTAVRSLMAKGDEWIEGVDLSRLRVLGSTGEPWNTDPWRWFSERVGGSRCPVINYSGGTETGGGIVGGTVVQPIKPCGFCGPVPGMIADVLDEHGAAVRGQVGELVVRQPWVGMTRGFWNDNERYLDAYWSRFPDIWVHGDWAEIDGDGTWFIRGRSDDTLNVAGKRIGPAEVESAAVSHDSVQEAAAIGVPDELKGEVIVAFVVLRPGVKLSDDLREEIRLHVGQQLGGSMRPSAVFVVTDLPRTRNGKVMRRVIRSAFLGLDPGDVTALENPDAVGDVMSAGKVAKERLAR